MFTQLCSTHTEEANSPEQDGRGGGGGLGGEMFPILVIGWQDLVVRGKEVGHFHKVAGMFIVAADGPHSAVDTVNS